MSDKSTTWYHPELDILRLCAFLMVFIRHVLGKDSVFGFPLPGGFGVDLFFTLSAYLITEILLREERNFGRFDIGAFYVRRILRIWPLYFVFLAFVFFVAPRFMSTESFSWKGRLMYLAFVGNWTFLLSAPIYSVATVLWSVSLEEQFYLVWPWVLRFWRSKLFYIGAGLLLVSTLYRLALVLHGPFPRPYLFYWQPTFARLDPIVIGALLAFALKGNAPDLRQSTRTMLGGLSCLGILAAGQYGLVYGPRSLFTYPLVAVCCAGLLISVLRPVRPGKAGVLTAALIHLGQISYGLYVFHDFWLNLCAHHLHFAASRQVQRVVQSAVALALTVVVAECSYRFLELPFLRLKQRFSVIKSEPIPQAVG